VKTVGSGGSKVVSIGAKVKTNTQKAPCFERLANLLRGQLDSLFWDKSTTNVTNGEIEISQ
jgi:hypothetical protein